MRSMTRHLTYANVVATLALVFALSGSAMAANHYLITSTKQIKPSILKKLHGANGARGPAGLLGLQGPAGAKGADQPESTELATLRGILPYVKFVAAGVGGKPTIQFTGANVQVVSGAGKTSAPVNGTGNLVVGYDEFPGAQTGSHNIILGEEVSYTSYGGLIAGESSSISAPFSLVLGGYGNEAKGPYSDILGGIFNTTTGLDGSVSGGEKNVAGGIASSVSGGILNQASGDYSSISGGSTGAAEGKSASISGGVRNQSARRIQLDRGRRCRSRVRDGLNRQRRRLQRRRRGILLRLGRKLQRSRRARQRRWRRQPPKCRRSQRIQVVVRRTGRRMPAGSGRGAHGRVGR